jgi:hypothetical protein
VQRLLRALRRKAAEQLIAQEPLGDATTAVPLPGSVDGSGYAGPDPPTAPPIERARKTTRHNRSVDIGSSAATAPSGYHSQMRQYEGSKSGPIHTYVLEKDHVTIEGGGRDLLSNEIVRRSFLGI